MESIWLRRSLIIVGMVFGLAAVISALLVSNTGSDDGLDISGAAVVELIPAPNSEVLSQSEVGIELEPGYQVELEINGTVIPDSQLGTQTVANRFTFIPGEGRAIERLAAEQNCVIARYWLALEGPQFSQTIQWCFSAA